MEKGHNIEAIYTLSSVQEGMLFYTLYTPTSGMYLNQYCFEIKGPFDRAAFVQAWDYIVARHAILRTAFIWENNEKAFQLVFRHLHLPLKEYDWRQYSKDDQQKQLQAQLQADIEQDFDLARPPLMRLKLIVLEPQRFYFIWTSHHLILDGWSRAIVIKELMAAYTAFHQGKRVTFSPAPQFQIYIAWLQRDLSEAEAYWRRVMEGITAPTQLLNAARKQEHRSLGRADTQEIVLSATLTTQLQKLARYQKTTLNILVLAAWALLLSTYSQERHVVFGVTTAGRPHDLADVEQMVGLFINTLPLHLEVFPSMSLSAWIQQVQRRQSELLNYQHVPVPKIHEWSSIPRELPLFESSFVFYNYPLNIDLQHMHLGNELTLHLQGHRGVELSHIPLVMMAHPTEKHNHLVLRLAYDTISFTSEHIARMLKQMLYFLEQMIALPQQKLNQFSLLTMEERKVLEKGKIITNDLSGICWPRLFEIQVRQQPDAIALIKEGEQITYQTLDRRADALSAVLRLAAVGEEVLVALLMERGIDFITALVAVFKAGGAVLPLDTRYPLARQAQIIAQSGTQLVLCGTSFVAPLRALLTQQVQKEPQVQLLAFEELDLQKRSDPYSYSSPHAASTLAYIMFTSGSTGQPKGAMIEHQGMLNHMLSKIDDLHLSRNDRIAQNGPVSFDIVIWQSLAALLVGGSICVLSDEIVADSARLCTLLEREGITILQIVPSLLRLLLQAATSERASFSTLRWLVPTGEALPGDLTRYWYQCYPTIPLLNTYGSTECSDDQCHYVIESNVKEDLLFPIVPIGRPIRNMYAYILNDQFQPLPIGVAGELYIGGEGVGRGYLDQPAATSERFLPDPFQREPGKRMYRTGDLARYLDDERIEFLRRTDQQVKIQGFRVEPGEIENVLATHPAVQSCVVTAQDVTDGSKRLVAYVVTHSTLEPVDGSEEKDAFSTVVEQQVTEWQNIYDERYARRQVSQLDPLTHFATWVSSYTRQPFSQEEIHACIEDSSRSILTLQPRRVLEIGCGSGLIARQLITHCEHYTGLDIAEHGLATLQEYLETAPERHASITLMRRAAHEVNDFTPASFDVIVLNEVVQYFPHISYLQQVLASIIPLVSTGGTIFLGDIRSLPHLSLFHTSVCLQQADAQLTVKDLRLQIDNNIAREKELLLSPDFFLILPQYIPQIRDVSIQYKFGAYDNEFTCFRYNVLLRIAEQEKSSLGTEEKDKSISSYDWQQENMSLHSLEHLLWHAQADCVLLTHVPNGRIQRYCVEQEMLSQFDEQQSVNELRTHLQQRTQMLQGVHPDQLLLIGDTTGYTTKILWEPEQTTTFSVCYMRLGAATKAYSSEQQQALELSQIPALSRYSNNPLLHALGERLIPRLRKFLQQYLPAYMVPTHFMLLDALPLSSNGKLDRHRLPQPDMQRPETGERYIPPQTSVEQLVAQIWQRVLGVDRIGLHDNFFALGGHSLLATQILSRLRSTFRMDLSLRELFGQPTVAGVVEVLQEHEPQPGHIAKITQAFERFQHLTEREKQELARQRRSK